jgi:hypothetical protein
VSPDLISRVRDTVLDEVREWQNRPLDRAIRSSFLMLCGSKSATHADVLKALAFTFKVINTNSYDDPARARRILETLERAQ